MYLLVLSLAHASKTQESCAPIELKVSQDILGINRFEYGFILLSIFDVSFVPLFF